MTPQERIKSRSVENANGCWIWTGATKGRGYGRLTVGSRSSGSRWGVAAHRYSYEAFKGPIPKGAYICHTCDTPGCVNPDHLFVGTAKDNAADAIAKGRHSFPPALFGEKSPRARLTDEQVRFIRSDPRPSDTVAADLGVTGGHVRAIRRGANRNQPPENSNG